MLLLSAFALLLCGGAFITYYFRVRRESLSQHVAMVISPSVTPRATVSGNTPRVFRPAANADLGAELREMGRLLARLHVALDWTPAAMIIARAAVALGAGALALFLALKVASLAAVPLVAFGLAFCMAVGGWFAVPWYLRRRVGKRVHLVEVGLPDALELLVVCVEAGLSLEDALERVVAELNRSRPELAEELALTSADLKILSNRDQALANLADRINIASVRSVVTTLTQTMRYGTPLAQALRAVASEMRNDSLLRLEERANRLPALLTVPMMLFIMPTIFLIVGGPAALRIIDIFFH